MTASQFCLLVATPGIWTPPLTSGPEAEWPSNHMESRFNSEPHAGHFLNQTLFLSSLASFILCSNDFLSTKNVSFPRISPFLPLFPFDGQQKTECLGFHFKRVQVPDCCRPQQLICESNHYGLDIRWRYNYHCLEAISATTARSPPSLCNDVIKWQKAV